MKVKLKKSAGEYFEEGIELFNMFPQFGAYGLSPDVRALVRDGSATYVDCLARNATRGGRCEVNGGLGNLLGVKQPPLNRHGQDPFLKYLIP